MAEINENNGIPVLKLDTPEFKLETTPTKTQEAVQVQNELEAFSPEEQKIVKEFAKKIDVTDNNIILNYGSDAQSKISSFSEQALSKVKAKDLGEVGNMISDLIVELRGFDATEESKGIFGFFKKQTNKLTALKSKYDTVEVNVDKIINVLEGHQVQLFKDVTMLDQLYEMNVHNYKQLSMYIAAGKMRLEEIRQTDLKELIDKAQKSGLPEDAQAVNDMAELCNRFEKKLHDLELTRTISIQMAPQIRMVQNSDVLMVEKIQTTLVNTIPLWKSQMVLALGMAHTQQAIKAQREVTDMTNELLRKNAELLKTSTIDAAKESERAIVDIETLSHTNEMLISTLDEVITIQDEGRSKRRAAEAELQKIEGDLKNKLLEMSKREAPQQRG
ncbi:toxic anion resistance protein [Alloiococcus sp. CFN-8]|uniref:toxic anion resistance protein n=1 Tax=Alloiococcus sp. CFN-8 TaxID=3416081 RepID=UPI003CE7128E